MTTKFTPLADRILVRRVAQDEKVGGIFIPDVAKEKPTEGEVVAVGEGKRATETGTLIPMSVKAGDRILFGKYNGSEIKIDGEEFIIMREDEILGILEGTL